VDASRFDLVVRSLHDSASRRTVAGGTLATGLGAFLGFLRWDDGGARKRKKRKKKRCKGDTKKCGKTCIPKTECCGACDAAESCCDGVCRNVLTDGANCGACGITCAIARCQHGTCLCNSGEDCPDICKCALSANGETVCAGPVTDDTCTTDDDCPARAVCRQTEGGTFCSEPCPA
jgi:hypothetical protein